MSREAVQLEHPTETSLLLRRSFAAPASLIWRFWTDPIHMVRWFGPEAARCGEVISDLRVGGEWRVEMLFDDDRRHVVGGFYREIEPPRRLVATWKWQELASGPSPDSLYSVELEEEADGWTALTLSHQLWSEEAATSHSQGWTSSLASLATAIAVQDGDI